MKDTGSATGWKGGSEGVIESDDGESGGGMGREPSRNGRSVSGKRGVGNDVKKWWIGQRAR